MRENMNPLRPNSMDNLHEGNSSVRRNGGVGTRASRSYPQLPSAMAPSGGVSFRTANVSYHPTVSDDSEEDSDSSFIDILWGIFAASIAMVCVGGLLITLTILYVVVRPFSLSVYRRLAAQWGEAAFLDAMALLLPNTRLYLTGDSDVPPPVGVSVLVSNHLMEVGDWWSLLMLGRVVGLRGSMKVFMRQEVLQWSKTKLPSPSTGTNGSNSASATAPNGGPSPTTLVAQTNKKALSRNLSNSGGFSGLNGGSSPTSSGRARTTDLMLRWLGMLCHAFLEFPLLMSGENNKDYVEDRPQLFELLRSFAAEHEYCPVHLLLFPEGWALHQSSNKQALLARSNEFAKREGRPQLQHLLLPRTTGFNASLDSLGEANPVVYDVTLAYSGYRGQMQPAMDLNLFTLWNQLCRSRKRRDVHIRIRRYSMDEVLADSNWLDKQWAEKDRILSHFARNQFFPEDSRGFCRHRLFETRFHLIEGSLLALVQLLTLPFCVPIILLLSFPIFWIVLWIWLFYKSFQFVWGVDAGGGGGAGLSATPRHAATTPGSTQGTPFLPATPWGSPIFPAWSMMMTRPAQQPGTADNNNVSPSASSTDSSRARRGGIS